MSTPNSQQLGARDACRSDGDAEVAGVIAFEHRDVPNRTLCSTLLIDTRGDEHHGARRTQVSSNT
jgi:hypothetical protein